MIKPIFVGSREYLGLEIEVRSREPGIWACVHLWIGGESLGREDDPVALYALMNSLDGVLGRGSSDSITSELMDLPANAAWGRLRNILNQHDIPMYHVPSTEFFDDYEIYCVSDNRIARFMWMARHWDPDILHDAKVPRSEVIRMLNELHDAYDNLSRNP
jgi:hypothetical protein